MQAVAGHMVHGGITTTTISTRNPPATAGTQQSVASSDSGATNAGQSTQARYNIFNDTNGIIVWTPRNATMLFQFTLKNISERDRTFLISRVGKLTRNRRFFF